MSKKLDLVFLCDTTGSMGSYLQSAKDNIENIITTIVSSEKCDVRFGLVEYRDHPPEDSTFAFRKTDFTDSMKTIKEAVNRMQANGGGDGPESVCCAMKCAVDMDYREDAAKVLVWIADAPPHGFERSGDGFPNGCPCGCDMKREVFNAKAKDIVIYSVGAEPLGFPYLRTLMRAVAEITGGKYAALASAKVLGDLIISGSREEIQLTEVANELLEKLQHDETFNSLDDEQKDKRLEEEVNKKLDSMKIDSVQIESIFENELDPVPELFLFAESLKQLKNEMYLTPDIKAITKDKFRGFGAAGPCYAASPCCGPSPGGFGAASPCYAASPCGPSPGGFGAASPCYAASPCGPSAGVFGTASPVRLERTEQSINSVSMSTTHEQKMKVGERLKKNLKK